MNLTNLGRFLRSRRGLSGTPLKKILVLSLVMAAASMGGTRSTLREAAAHRWLVGTAITSQQLDQPATVALITQQFDHLTAEYEFFPQFVHPKPDQYTFANADRVADFAAAHHLPLTGHMLCWGQFTGDWMYQDADHKPLPRDAALKNLKDHIDTVVRHFHGKVDSWDVVNEAVSDQPDEFLRNTPARQVIGDDYIQKAFEYAHAADPTVTLYYNDYNVEDPAKLPKVLKLIRTLKSHGLRIDGVGIQGHWLLNYPSTDSISAALDALEKEHLKVYITELDIDVLPRNKAEADLAHIQDVGANPYVNGLPAEVAAAEAQRYADLFKVFKTHGGTIASITFWGVNDGQSWLNGYPVKGRTNYPLLFDRNLKPNGCYDAVMRVLSET